MIDHGIIILLEIKYIKLWDKKWVRSYIHKKLLILFI